MIRMRLRSSLAAIIFSIPMLLSLSLPAGAVDLDQGDNLWNMLERAELDVAINRNFRSSITIVISETDFDARLMRFAPNRYAGIQEFTLREGEHKRLDFDLFSGMNGFLAEFKYRLSIRVTLKTAYNGYRGPMQVITLEPLELNTGESISEITIDPPQRYLGPDDKHNVGMVKVQTPKNILFFFKLTLLPPQPIDKYNVSADQPPGSEGH